MIDFRFHLISLVAVFLALGLGVLMGSVVLDQALTNRLQSNVAQLQKDKNDFQEEVLSLEDRLSANVRFADVAEEWLLRGRLRGQKVVVMRFGGTDDRVIDGVRTSIEAAGGELASDIVLTDKFRLPSQIERDQLALVVASTSGTAADLRAEAGETIGTRLATAALAGENEGRINAAHSAAEGLIEDLADAGFVDLDRPDEGQLIPGRALFVLAGGGPETRPFNVSQLAIDLAEAITDRGAELLIAESSDSRWALVSAVRATDVENDVTTVDDAESIAGRIAVGLALAESLEGVTGHYGVGPGAADVIPKPPPDE
ncbi:MAG TPA: copper transporter [Actinomycetota bacterium]|nr:copper transporter [Actinomycetota bacterium]